MYKVKRNRRKTVRKKKPKVMRKMRTQTNRKKIKIIKEGKDDDKQCVKRTRVRKSRRNKKEIHKS